MTSTGHLVSALGSCLVRGLTLRLVLGAQHKDPSPVMLHTFDIMNNYKTYTIRLFDYKMIMEVHVDPRRGAVEVTGISSNPMGREACGSNRKVIGLQPWAREKLQSRFNHTKQELINAVVKEASCLIPQSIQ